MADNNSDTQIKESILSTNEILLGNSTAKAMSTMYLNLAHAAGMASQNAVTNQQHLNILGAAAVAASASGLLRTGMADQIEKMSPADRLDYLQKLLTLSANPAAAPAQDTSTGSTASGSDTSAPAESGTAETEPAAGSSTSGESTAGTTPETATGTTGG